MAARALPFLMFQGDAETAMNLYVSAIRGTEITEITPASRAPRVR
jgi:predicted 3-demethylubiquinone-9 3-methyltransferase (glyoxalase superfamily)